MSRTRIHHVATLLATVLVLSGCTAQVISEHVPSSAPTTKPELDGLYYALPRTVITVDVPVTLTTYSDGPYFKYYYLFFPDTKVKGTKLAFGEPKIGSHGEPDPDQVYVMRGEGRGAIAQTLTFLFSETGSITGIKADVTNNTADIALAGLGVITNIITSTVKTGSLYKPPPPPVRCSTSERAIGNLSDDEKMKYFSKCVLPGTNERVRLDELVANFLKLPRPKKVELVTHYYGFGTDGLPTKDSWILRDALAQYAAIAELRAAASPIFADLLGPAYDVTNVLKLAAERESKLLIDFQQAATETEWTAKLEVLIPACRSGCTFPMTYQLVEYEANAKLCGLNPLSSTAVTNVGTTIPSALTPTTCASTKKTLDLVVDQTSGTQLSTRLSSQYTSPQRAALYFNVPLRANAAVVTDSKTLGRAELSIAQLGAVLATPSDLGGKGVLHDTQFYESTGALKSYTLTTKSAVETGTVDSLGGIANTILAAREKEKEAEANADFNALTRASETAELLLKLQKACAELANPTDACEGT